MNVVEVKTVRTEVRRQVELNGAAIRELLERAGVDVPFTADVTVLVPGGGDYSNMSVDIDDRMPVVVAWTEVTQT